MIPAVEPTSPFYLKSQVLTSFGSRRNDDGELESEYVLAIDGACDGSHFAASLSDGSFRVYGGFPEVVLFSHQCGKPIQTLKCSNHSPQLIYTAFVDGEVSVWDIRSPAPLAQRISLPLSGDDELSCADLSRSDSMLATAAGNSVYFYDARKAFHVCAASTPSLLGQYSDCHSDTITQIKFNKDRPSVLTSAGEDGLLCTYDTSAPPNSEAVVSVLNIECPVRNFFYFGHDSTGICSMSSVETLSCWHYPSAQRICHFPDVRATHTLDYVLDGWYVREMDALFVLGGSYAGDATILSVTPERLSTVAFLRSGHSASLRCCRYMCGTDGASAQIVTGAEDAKLCTWTNSPTAANVKGTLNGSRPIKSSARRVAAGVSPY